MPERKAATIRDVARRANVSPATVSRFLNGSLHLPEATATRVSTAVAELDYRPNALARNLSLGQSHILGLVVPDIANPFFSELAKSVEAEALAHGYNLILCSTDSDPNRELEYFRQLEAKQLDGILFLTDHSMNDALKGLLLDQGNVVLLDEDVIGTDLPRVLSDNRAGGVLATQHLIGLGHRRIAHIGGPPDLTSANERYDGYVEAMSAAELDLDEALIHRGRYSQETGALGLAVLLDQPSPPTAIFAAADYIAIGVLREARARGIPIPMEMSIVGFDGISIAQLLSPPLTTVVQQIGEFGRQGVQLLVARLNGEKLADNEVRLGVRLETRESTQAA